MSPLFGHKDETGDEQPDAGALGSEVDRLDSLTLAELAVEVMNKGFGPGGPGADEAETVTTGGPNINAGATVSQIAGEFMPGGSSHGADASVVPRLNRLIAEGLQSLEHASLIRAQLHTEMGGLDFALTRLGRAALRDGSVESAVTQRAG
jgi:hypothetical protein